MLLRDRGTRSSTARVLLDRESLAAPNKGQSVGLQVGPSSGPASAAERRREHGPPGSRLGAFSQVEVPRKLWLEGALKSGRRTFEKLKDLGQSFAAVFGRKGRGTPIYTPQEPLIRSVPGNSPALRLVGPVHAVDALIIDAGSRQFFGKSQNHFSRQTLFRFHRSPSSPVWKFLQSPPLFSSPPLSLNPNWVKQKHSDWATGWHSLHTDCIVWCVPEPLARQCIPAFCIAVSIVAIIISLHD
jgi:hypothetical protein